MASMVLTLLGAWLLTATVVGLVLGRIISTHEAGPAEASGSSKRSTRAA
jgi:hypothetical protein